MEPLIVLTHGEPRVSQLKMDKVLFLLRAHGAGRTKSMWEDFKACNMFTRGSHRYFKLSFSFGFYSWSKQTLLKREMLETEEKYRSANRNSEREVT